MSNFKKLNLESFANGAAAELFQRELDIVLTNMDDPNTKDDLVRTITLKFSIRPDAEQETARLFVEARSSLAPVKGAIGQSYFGRQNGKLNAYSHNINQMELNLDTKPKVVEEQA